MTYKIIHGDTEAELKTFPDNHFDSIVTDPPYGLCLMKKKWDYTIPSVAMWSEHLRVLKPGGHILAFAGSRTYHRMACNIEDAGFEIRDMMVELYDTQREFLEFTQSLNGKQKKTMARWLGADGLLAWIYGSGFNKGFNTDRMEICQCIHGNAMVTNRALDAKPLHNGGKCPRCGRLKKEFAKQSSTLKPALEPLVLARKPLAEKTIAANILKWGTGGLNVGSCMVSYKNDKPFQKSGSNESKNRSMSGKNYARGPSSGSPKGRFPANLIHDGSKASDGIFPYSKSGEINPCERKNPQGRLYGRMSKYSTASNQKNEGSASRFFESFPRAYYCSKATGKERDSGLWRMEKKKSASLTGEMDGSLKTGAGNLRDTKRTNIHPTVKPIKLMRWLCRLITPKNGTILDGFAGSGSTGVAAIHDGFNVVLIEQDIENLGYCEIIEARCADAAEYMAGGALFNTDGQNKD